MEKDVLVSIVCLAYNHEKYIRETIEGFINQKTSFVFEVLINDDASTDKTAEIIKDYERKYPNIIKAVYQKENQHTKRDITNLTMYLLGKSRGKYFAFCEGDDYWNDQNKLQIQIDFLESHPDYSWCIHNSHRINKFGENLSDLAIVSQSRDMTTEEIIKGGGGLCATNSIVGRMKYVITAPDFLIENGLDYTWQIYLAGCGKTYCFRDCLSVYRVASEGSWSERMENNPTEYAKVFKRIATALEEYDAWTEKRYHNIVQEGIISRKYSSAYKLLDASILEDKEVLRWIKSQPVGFRLKTLLWTKFPKIYNCIRRSWIRKKYKFTIY